MSEWVMCGGVAGSVYVKDLFGVIVKDILQFMRQCSRARSLRENLERKRDEIAASRVSAYKFEACNGVVQSPGS